MTDHIVLQQAVANAKTAGVASRTKEATLYDFVGKFLVERAMSRLPEAVKEAVRRRSWGILMELSLGDFPETYTWGSRQLTGEQLKGPGKQVFETCKNLGLNPRVDFGSYKVYLIIEP